MQSVCFFWSNPILLPCKKTKNPQVQQYQKVIPYHSVSFPIHNGSPWTYTNSLASLKKGVRNLQKRSTPFHNLTAPFLPPHYPALFLLTLSPPAVLPALQGQGRTSNVLLRQSSQNACSISSWLMTAQFSQTAAHDSPIFGRIGLSVIYYNSYVCILLHAHSIQDTSVRSFNGLIYTFNGTCLCFSSMNFHGGNSTDLAGMVDFLPASVLRFSFTVSLMHMTLYRVA